MSGCWRPSLTPPKLVKERLPGDRYKTSGSIEGLVEGRRTIRNLRIRNAEGGVGALGALASLESLVSDGGVRLDLDELAALPARCEFVALASLSETDLGRLRLPETVRMFGMSQPNEGCLVTGVPQLPEMLVDLGLSVDSLADANCSVAVLQRFIESLDWRRLSELERLDVVAYSHTPGYPLELDLGLLRCLSGLERADVFGVRHRRSAGASPLEPPFEGLPKSLSWLRIDTELPVDELKAQIDAYLGCDVSVEPLYLPRPSDQPWWISESDTGSGLWLSAGSFASYFSGLDFDEEARALRHARGVIKRADAALLRRLDFDEDADSTMVMAKSRADMVAALECLGIQAPNA